MNQIYCDLSDFERAIVIRIANAIGNGLVGPHNRAFPAMARRVFDALSADGLLAGTLKKPHEQHSAETRAL